MANIFKNLIKSAISKTKENLTNSIKKVFIGSSRNLDFTEFEEILIKSDFGLDFSEKLIKVLKEEIKEQEPSEEHIKTIIKKFLQSNIIISDKEEFDKKNVLKIIQIIGVNGSGKTTTIGKFANYLKTNGYKVLIASCDTFRAAANEQLLNWAKKIEVEIIEDFSKDPAAVAFESISRSIANKHDFLLIDTAGRLHTNSNLMQELKKIDSVSSKFTSNVIEKETWLVVDGNSGQNAKKQFLEFSKYVKIDGFIITKLDGTAKGGSIIQIAYECKIPIKFIGIGETLESFQKFEINEYINSLIG